MTDILREAPLGQLIRWVTKKRLLPYPEELPGFELPETYRAVLESKSGTVSKTISHHSYYSPSAPSTPDLEKKDTHIEPRHDDVEALGLHRTKSRQGTTPYTE